MRLFERLLARITWAIFVVWAVASMTFVINGILPSDPARLFAGPQARAADVARIRHELGLDRPVLSRYGLFMGRLVHVVPRSESLSDGPVHASCARFGFLHVDLGKSYRERRPVVDILADRIPPTVSLAAFAIAFQVVVGIGIGAFAARRQGTGWDAAAIGLTVIGISTPTFVVGIILQYLLGYRLRILPLDGYGDTATAHIISVILPGITLGIFGSAYYARLAKDELVTLSHAAFVRTARAKGMSEARILFVHLLRNAALPLVTLAGLDLGALLGGAVVTETLFRWPGLGSLSVSAVLDRDGPVVVGVVLLTSSAIVLVNLALDFVYTLLDPRAAAP